MVNKTDKANIKMCIYYFFIEKLISYRFLFIQLIQFLNDDGAPGITHGAIMSCMKAP